jgi:hypothetical protein
MELICRKLLEQSDNLVSEIAELEDDILIPGIVGKMDPALSRLG